MQAFTRRFAGSKASIVEVCSGFPGASAVARTVNPRAAPFPRSRGKPTVVEGLSCVWASVNIWTVFWMVLIFGNIVAVNVRLGTEIAAQHGTLFLAHGPANRTFNFQRRIIVSHATLFTSVRHKMMFNLERV
jgi:hypothetical protein